MIPCEGVTLVKSKIQYTPDLLNAAIVIQSLVKVAP